MTAFQKIEDEIYNWRLSGPGITPSAIIVHNLFFDELFRELFPMEAKSGQLPDKAPRYKGARVYRSLDIEFGKIIVL